MDKKKRNIITAIFLILIGLLSAGFLAGLEFSPYASSDRLLPTSAPAKLLAGDHQADTGPSDSSKGTKFREHDAVLLARAPYKAEVGVYPVNNYGVDFSVPSFESTGYLWLKWNQALQDYMEAKGRMIQDLIVPINYIGGNNGTILRLISDQSKRLSDGNYYALFSYAGKFYIDDINFKNYPFATVGLTFAFEADSDELLYSKLRLIPDLRNSSLGGYSDIPGWISRGYSFREIKHIYGTNLGLSGHSDLAYSQALFHPIYSTSATASFWKLLQPIFVVMAMVAIASKLPSALNDVRIGIPVTVLLTLVFLQQSYQSSLPSLPYLTFLDKIYVGCYISTLITFVFSVWIARRQNPEVAAQPGPLDYSLLQRIELIDDLWPAFTLCFLTVWVTGAWYLF